MRLLKWLRGWIAPLEPAVPPMWAAYGDDTVGLFIDGVEVWSGPSAEAYEVGAGGVRACAASAAMRSKALAALCMVKGATAVEGN